MSDAWPEAPPEGSASFQTETNVFSTETASVKERLTMNHD